VSEDRRPGQTGTAEGSSGSRTVTQGTSAVSDHRCPAGAAASPWQGRREQFAAWLPVAGRLELEARALREFDRGEAAAFLIAEEHRRADCAAQRQASHAIADALDWSAQSRRPSHAEMERRRAVIA